MNNFFKEKQQKSIQAKKYQVQKTLYFALFSSNFNLEKYQNCGENTITSLMTI